MIEEVRSDGDVIGLNCPVERGPASCVESREEKERDLANERRGRSLRFMGHI